MRAGRAVVLACAAAAVLASGCGSDSDPEPAAEPVVRRTATPEPTETEPTDDAPAEASPTDAEASPPPTDDPTTAASSEPSPPDLPEATGRDWQQVAQQLLDIQTAAYEYADTSLLVDAFRSVCNCWEFHTGQIATLNEEGGRFEYQSTPRIVDVQVHGMSDLAGTVTLIVEIDLPEVAIIDIESSKVARTLDGRRVAEWWTLATDDAEVGPWRMIDATYIEDVA